MGNWEKIGYTVRRLINLCRFRHQYQRCAYIRKGRDMSSFKQLQPQRFPPSAPVATTSTRLRPLQTLAAVSTPVSEPTASGLERTARLEYSLARIPLFPPASDGGTSKQGELLQEKSEDTQNKENITRLFSGLKTGIGSLSQFPIQTKLIIGPAHNQYEREADQMADLLMRVNVATETDEQALQSSKQPEEEKLKLRNEPELQRASADAGFEASPDFESRIANSKSGGNPLPDSVRAFMESRFGADFSGVRLHTDNESAQLNRAVNARAFTRGQEIYLGEGEIDFATSEGKRLLAHELTHTIQQGAVPRKIHPRLQQNSTLQDKVVRIRGEDAVPHVSEKMGTLASQLKERQQLTRDSGLKAITMSNSATGLIVQRTKWKWTGSKWRPTSVTKNPGPTFNGKKVGDTYDDKTGELTPAAEEEKEQGEWGQEKGNFTSIKGKGNSDNALGDLKTLIGTKPILHQEKSGTVVGGIAIKKGKKIDGLNDPSARIDIQNSPGKGLYNVQYQKETGSVCGIKFTGDDQVDTLYQMLLKAFAEGGFRVSPSYEEKRKKKGK